MNKMKYFLSKRPKRAVIIEGFPTFGLVGSIVTQYLIDKLNMEKIGNIFSKDLSPVVAIHQNRVYEPISIFYNKHYNLIVIHSITPIQGIEWEYAKVVQEIGEVIGAREIISVDGLITNDEKNEIFFKTSSEKKREELLKLNAKELEEGVLVGVIATLISLSLHQPKIPHTAIFSKIESMLPDSRAAANIIKFLDSYLGMNIEYKDLLEQAKQFENKIKEILKTASEKNKDREKTSLSYFV